MFTKLLVFAKICVKINVDTHPPPSLVPILSSNVFDRVVLDYTYMKERNGFKYILQLVDHFSKFVVAKKTKTKTEENVIEFIEKIVNTYNLKLNLVHTDNGGEFVAKETVGVIKKYGGEPIRGTPYHPQSQGAVERLNDLSFFFYIVV